MKIYVINKNGVIDPDGYVSLKKACDKADVAYSTAQSGKRAFNMVDEDTGLTTGFVLIHEIEVNKITGRATNTKKARAQRDANAIKRSNQQPIVKQEANDKHWEEDINT